MKDFLKGLGAAMGILVGLYVFAAGVVYLDRLLVKM